MYDSQLSNVSACILTFTLNIFALVGEVTGNSTSRVPYSKLKKIGVTVDGLPEGIVFKHPSSYGRRQLQQIIATKNDIKFNGNYMHFKSFFLSLGLTRSSYC